jgi:hypothetical protein
VISERSREGEYDDGRMRVSWFPSSITNSIFTTHATNLPKLIRSFSRNHGAYITFSCRRWAIAYAHATGREYGNCWSESDHKPVTFAACC